MKKYFTLLALLLPFAVSAQQNAYVGSGKNSLAAVKGVDMGAVQWNDGFWKDRFDLCLSNIVPAQWDYFMGFTEDNFKIQTGEIKSDIGFRGTNWQDGDYYKWLEAQISVYSVTKDKELLKSINERAERIARSIAEDGYISLNTQIGYGASGNETDKLKPFSDRERYASPSWHETYNMGHFLVMANTHYRVTGDDMMLNAAIRVGDFLAEFFGDITPEKAHLDYNSVQVMGLMELYRSTGDNKYLDCVNRTLTARGQVKGRTQNQNDRQLRKETEAVGHAVLAPVLYIGATDYCTETDDKELLTAMKTIWEDIYLKKASITGGLGNMHNSGSERNREEAIHEAFGLPYHLANSTAYNETCATFYGAYFSWRLFLLTGESKYLDVMEKAFYNNLSSVALDGESYFYTNVLRWHGDEHDCLSLDFHHRWTTECTCVCCPTSLVRFVAQTKDYSYAVNDNSLFVTLYGSNSIDTKVAGKNVKFTQTTQYPWNDKIEFEYSGDKGADFNLKLRIPVWANGASLKLNGKEVAVGTEGFATIANNWTKGDKVELILPITPTLVEADPRVEQTRGQVAVQCGPLIYCAEEIDLPSGVKMDDIVIAKDAKFNSTYKGDFLAGVNIVSTKDAMVRTNDFKKGDALYAPLSSELKPITLNLIPYYAWANRGDNEMSIYFPVKW
ncbi:MAG: glycoside hydrolase family 127 protein [Rikenellaceae bacterium]